MITFWSHRSTFNITTRVTDHKEANYIFLYKHDTVFSGIISTVIALQFSSNSFQMEQVNLLAVCLIPFPKTICLNIYYSWK